MPQLVPKTVSVFSDAVTYVSNGDSRGAADQSISIAGGGKGAFITLNRCVASCGAQQARYAQAPFVGAVFPAGGPIPAGHSIDYVAVVDPSLYGLVQYGRQEALISSMSLPAFLANMEWMEAAFRYNNRRPIFVNHPGYPTTSVWTAAAKARLATVNSHIAAAAFSKSVPLVDVSSLALSLTEMDSPGRYPNPHGEHRIGLEIGRQVAAILSWY